MKYNGLDTWVLRVNAILATAILMAASIAPSFADESNTSAKGPNPSDLRNTQENRDAEKLKHHEPDLSGKKRVGKASFYAKQFAGKPMADGAPMDPHGNNAASKTLPLGTTAKVTNLETGQSAVVTIRDRGPYVPGRIVDLSPATARQIGISQRKGVAQVVVAPITVPQPGGGIKLGAAVHEPLFDAPRPSQVARGSREVESSRPLREATADAFPSTLHRR